MWHCPRRVHPAIIEVLSNVCRTNPLVYVFSKSSNDPILNLSVFPVWRDCGAKGTTVLVQVIKPKILSAANAARNI